VRLFILKGEIMTDELNDIAKFKKLVSEIQVEYYNQAEYTKEVDTIFKEIFTCPDKLEPKSHHLPEKARKIIQQKYGLGRSET
tara:strand:+ start:66 stop:314 length:249 start_codon:yes stop_codon:yes gene_type:complete